MHAVLAQQGTGGRERPVAMIGRRLRVGESRMGPH